jgi:hypothetical protein
MPAGTEQKIHQQLADLESGSILSPIKGKEIALKILKALFESGLSVPEGPLQVGPEKKMLSARMPGWAEEFKPE